MPRQIMKKYAAYNSETGVIEQIITTCNQAFLQNFIDDGLLVVEITAEGIVRTDTHHVDLETGEVVAT